MLSSQEFYNLQLRNIVLETALSFATNALKAIASSNSPCNSPTCTVNAPECDVMIARCALRDIDITLK